MAVYERTYRGYGSVLTPAWSRFLILPRYAYQEVFASRFFVAFLVVCYLFPVSCAVWIYLPHNLSFLTTFGLEPGDLWTIDGRFFLWYLRVQGTMAFFLAFVAGPALISADTRNNGLPLYLSRPFSRSEYVLGKMAALLILLSAVTWVPGLALFLLQAYLGGRGWLAGNLWLGPAIFLGSWIWMLVLCLVMLAVSAFVKWKTVARMALLAIFFVASAAGLTINGVLRTRWGSLLDIRGMIGTVWAALFGVESSALVPLWTAWLSLLGLCGVCLLLLARKVRAYEVVR